jgi:uncharacterized coiled-coil protein SlyX
LVYTLYQPIYNRGAKQAGVAQSAHSKLDGDARGSSLASALSIPLLLNKQPFPHRNLILFITFVVIIVTLVGQGLTLPFIVRKLKPEPLSEDKTDDQQILEIEIALLERAVEELGENYPLDLKNNVLLQNKLDLLKNKLKLYSDSCYNEPQKRLSEK